jgi:hypothetical protein
MVTRRSFSSRSGSRILMKCFKLLNCIWKRWRSFIRNLWGYWCVTAGDTRNLSELDVRHLVLINYTTDSTVIYSDARGKCSSQRCQSASGPAQLACVECLWIVFRRYRFESPHGTDFHDGLFRCLTYSCQAEYQYDTLK